MGEFSDQLLRTSHFANSGHTGMSAEEYNAELARLELDEQLAEGSASMQCVTPHRVWDMVIAGADQNIDSEE